jgi:hypothetical protein
MRTAVVPLLLCGLHVSAAFAQREPDAKEFDGKWNVSIQAASGRPHAAKLTLENFAGTWYEAASSDRLKAKACRGKNFPVTVQTSKAAELEFTAWGASIGPACPDISVSVRPVGPKVLEGTLASGESIRLTRP